MCIYTLTDRMLLKACLLLFLHEDVKTFLFCFPFWLYCCDPRFFKEYIFVLHILPKNEVSECLP